MIHSGMLTLLTNVATVNLRRYTNQNNFLRSIKNFRIDITNTAHDAQICGIHWQVAQGTSLENIEFHMSFDEDTTQQVGF